MKKWHIIFAASAALFLFTFNIPAHSQTGNSSFNWRLPTGGRIAAGPTAGDNGSIYIVSEDRFLYNIDPQGEIVWRTRLDYPGTASLSRSDGGILYAGSSDRRLTAYNPSGRKLWSRSLIGDPVGNPVIDNSGRVYVVTDEAFLVSFSHTGRLRWSVLLPSIPSAAPVINAMGSIQVPCADERLYSYNPWGQRQWTFLFAGIPTGLSADNKGNTYAGTYTGTVASVSPEGTLNWSATLGRPAFPPVVTEDALYAGGGSNLYRLTFDGELVWQMGFPSDAAASPLVSATSVFLATESGFIGEVSFDGEFWSERSGGPGSGQVSMSGGQIYWGGDDWILYAFRGKPDAPPSKAPWPLPKGNKRLNAVPEDLGETPPPVTFNAIYIRETSRQQQHALKSSLLDEIEEAAASGKPLWEEEGYYLDALHYLAGEAFTRPITESGRLINDHPDIRLRAVRLLSVLGTVRTSRILASQLRHEWAPEVITAIFETLGILSYDTEGKIMDMVSSRFSKLEEQRLADSRTADAALGAVLGLASWSGGINDAGFDLLRSIYSGPYSRSSRTAALQSLARYKSDPR